jgi:hypothetical protein
VYVTYFELNGWWYLLHYFVLKGCNQIWRTASEFRSPDRHLLKKRAKKKPNNPINPILVCLFTVKIELIPNLMKNSVNYISNNNWVQLILTKMYSLKSTMIGDPLRTFFFKSNNLCALLRLHDRLFVLVKQIHKTVNLNLIDNICWSFLDER